MINVTCKICGEQALFHAVQARSRTIWRELWICEDHAVEILGGIPGVPLARNEGGTSRSEETAFDVELLLGKETGDQLYIYLREVTGSRHFYYSPEVCGAQAVRWALLGGGARPLGANVTINAIRSLGAEVGAAVMHDMADATILAALRVMHNGRQFEIDSRPSDAIAFAIAAGAPILVSEKLLPAPNAQTWPPPGKGVG